MEEWYIKAYFDRDSRVSADDVPTRYEKMYAGAKRTRGTLERKSELERMDDGITRHLGTPYQRTKSKFLGIGSEKVDMYLDIKFDPVMASNPPAAVIALAKNKKPNHSTSSAYSGPSTQDSEFDLLKRASVFEVGTDISYGHTLPRSDFDFSQI